eukprot:NODE_1656_length_1091_cov_439.149614.p1 GENE.NODE_1656_length_1091_cov_439.149614~~NODE_1656_length_1091_cov_439.149614.p1  ORF type:complete len:258 (+),score=73.35 NODE_1656_length_1091_cov_439.149614:173-946(+)
MLLDVLGQLSQVCGTVYDPVDFDFERLDQDGIFQRLDLNTQVRHLQQDAGTLTVVRKDAPVSKFRLLQTWRVSEPGRGRRPPGFPFTEYAASLATEYFVAVHVRGSRVRSTNCVLVVDREKLTHTVAPAEMFSDDASGSPSPKRGGGSLLTRSLRHLQLDFPTHRDREMQAEILTERRVQDVRDVSHQVRSKRGFMVTYATPTSADGGDNGDNGGELQMGYRAQTPTECVEIVARIQFLLTLGPLLTPGGNNRARAP